MTPGGPSPLKHGRRFTSTTLVECRLSLGTAGRFLLQHVCVADNRRLFSDVESAASFAARIDGVGEQPGRERPHRWTPDPDPRVGSGVAHVPAAGDWNHVDVLPESRAESAGDLRRAIADNSAGGFG